MTKKSVNISGTKHAQFDPHDLPTQEIEYKTHTDHSDYEDDRTTDPEGATRRASTAGREAFPAYVFDEYKLSTRTYWKGKWPDGGEHLIPLESTVDNVFAIHEENKDALIHLADKYNKSYVDPFVDATTEFLDNMPFSVTMNFMRGFSNSVESTLAERAYQRYLFERAVMRLTDDGKDDYLEGLETRMLEASESAGNMFAIHLKLWEHLQWKNEPSYPRIRNAIALRLTNAAKWVDENRRIEVSKTTQVSREDRLKLAQMC